MSTTVESILKESVDEFISIRERGGIPQLPTEQQQTALQPWRVFTKTCKEGTLVGAEVLNGRSLWLSSIRTALRRTVRVLLQHKWTVLNAPPGLSWFTSDNPVVRLNFRSTSDYDLRGGWGVEKGNIFMPLTPRHLLFTEIGERSPQRGTEIGYGQAKLIRKFLAENAWRAIFADKIDSEVEALRPRVVDKDQFDAEKRNWSGWHHEQAEAEREFARA